MASDKDLTRHGIDWKALIGLIAPIAGTFASRGGGADLSFTDGWQKSQHAIQQETLRQQQEDQKRGELSAKYLLEIGQHAQSLDDPIDFQNFIALAEDAGMKAGFTQPGEIGSKLTFSSTKQAEKQLRELAEQLDGVEKRLPPSVSLDDLADSGQFLETKSGKRVPIRDAMKLTRRGPVDASGSPVALPKKPTPTTGTETERAQQLLEQMDAAEASGDQATRDRLMKQYQNLLRAKKDLGQADDKPGNAKLDEINLALKELALQNGQQRLADAKKSATPIAVVPGSKEYRVAQDLAYGKLTMAQFRSLYSYARDVNAKTSIYEKASELNPEFNPAAFEMGFTLAKNPRVQQQLSSMDNVIEAVPDLIAASEAAKRSGVTILNQYTSPIKVAIGSKTFANLKIARVAFADELSGALGFGSATDMSREMGFNMTDPNLSPENFASAIRDVVVPFIQRKRDTLLKQMGVYGQQGFNPAAATPAPAQPGALQPTHRYNPATGAVEPIR